MYFPNSIPLFTSAQPTIIPWDFQVEARDAIFAYYAANGGNPLVVMPTGTGKSVVIADFMTYTLLRWPRQRLMCVTHVKELIAQNAETLKEVWPQAPFGIYSDGLKQYDTQQPIVFAGIQSIFQKAELFGHRDVLLIDEAHMVGPSDTARYHEFIAGLKKINPRLVIIGFTATHYRQGQGLLTEGDERVFTDIALDMSGVDRFNRFIDEGYLCPLIPLPTSVELNTDNVKITGGDFAPGELEKAVDTNDLTYRACRELAEQGARRRCWLTFAAGKKHAEHVAECLPMFGIDSMALHSGTLNRDRIIERHKNGDLRSLVVYGIGTTGYNVKQLDLIGMLRPTMSTSLWVQMLGRGTRPFYASGFDLRTIEGRLAAILLSVKQNCLVLDMARNTPRLGPINDPTIPQRRVKGMPGDAPIKLCPICTAYNHARALVCCNCGNPFNIVPKLMTTAGTSELIRRYAPPPDPVYHEFPVTDVSYSIHQKDNKPPGIQIEYLCGIRKFNEYKFPEGAQFARKNFRNWWRTRSTDDPPLSTADAMQKLANVAKPKQIRMRMDLQYPEVDAVKFD